MGSSSAAGADSTGATNSTANETTGKSPIHFRSKKYPGSGFNPEFWKDVTSSGAVAPASKNSGHGPTAVFEPRSGRWRDNQYIRDDGILPWQMCSSDSLDYRPKVSWLVLRHGKSLKWHFALHWRYEASWWILCHVLLSSAR